MRAHRLLWPVILFVLAAISTTVAQVSFNDPGFSVQTVTTVPSYNANGFTWAPDGRMFIWEKSGVVKILKNGTLLATPFLNISGHVNVANDRGLMGFALDPNFESNGYVYLAYAFENAGTPTSTSPRTLRVTRMQASSANPDVANPASEIVIVGKISNNSCTGVNEDCIPDTYGYHTVDNIAFGPDGKLYISIGDGGTPFTTDYHALRAQNIDEEGNGKLMRVNPNGTGPSDNPFYNGDPTAVRSKIYSYGLRNPFRFTVSSNGTVYIGNVGWNTWEAIDVGRGANFGWPCYEGPNPQPSYQSKFAQCQQLPASAVTKPFYDIQHPASECIIAGPIYTGNVYPAMYQGDLFFADYTDKWIKRLIFKSDGTHTVVNFASNVNGPVYLAQGPDGLLYVMEFNTGHILRIRFTGSGNPVAKASASPTSGPAPLDVNFSSSGSYDPDADPITYSWNFGDGATSINPNPVHQYASNGTYVATLTVSDPGGATGSSSVTITVANSGSCPPATSPGVTICSPANNSSVNSPVHVLASAVSSHPISSMWVYVDNVADYKVHAALVDTYLPMPSGSHRIDVKAWDSSGALYKQTVFITVP